MIKTTTGQGDDLKSELHHWWPKSLSRYWADSQGFVTQISPNGTERRAPPKQFGAVTNAHQVRPGGSWNFTFEPSFGIADSEFPRLVEWLLQLQALPHPPKNKLRDRISGAVASEGDIERLALCTGSMTARTPFTRSTIAITTELYRDNFGLIEPKPDQTLIALNQMHLFNAHFKSMRGHGRWAVLISDCDEFIFGDGFLHNFNTTSNPTILGRCILPMTPTHTIVYDSPTSYPSQPRVVTIMLDREEVKMFNDIIQVYSCTQLYYRSQRPSLGSAFEIGKHQTLKYHRSDWLDWFISALTQFPDDGAVFGSRLSEIPAGLRRYFE